VTRILVTGAGGLIGARAAKAAAAAGHEVLRLKHKGEEAGALLRDLRRPLQEVPPCQAVFHLAGGYAGLSRFGDLRMARNLAAWGGKNGVKTWVIASAAEVYGRIDGLGTEQSPLRPVIPYGRVKRQVEECFAALPARVVILRIGEVYGPESRLLGEITARLQRGFCPWPGAGRVPVSFVHAGDVAQAFLAAMERAPAGVSVFNVADSTPSTWRDFICRVAEILGTPPPRFLPLALARAYAWSHEFASLATGRRPVLTRHVVRLLTTPKALSTARIVQELGFVPRHPDIRGGLEACLGLPHHAQDGGAQTAPARASA
jgi:2-alkyl-3-oxoalkanoate reductase